MKHEFIRTGTTNLTDNELILFDAIFDSSCPVEQLKSNGFDERFNFAYQHSFTDKDLIDCLENLQSQNLIKIKDSIKNEIGTKYINLTAKGGKLWEKEREPIWEKYLIDLCDHVDHNKRVVTVKSPTLETIEDYLKIAEKLKLNDLTEIHKTTFKIENRKYLEGLHWKRFAEIHIATIIGWQSDEDSENWHKVDWNYYNENLNWWRNVRELNSLKRKTFQNNYEQ